MLNLTVKPIIQVTIEEIVNNLLLYLQRVEAGETLVLTRAGQPVAAIQPITQEKVGLRPYGLCAGMFRVPNDFDDPLPEDLLEAFEGR